MTRRKQGRKGLIYYTTAGSENRNSRQELKEGQGGKLLTALLSMICSACFLLTTQDHLWVKAEPPRMAVLSPLIKSKFPQACPQPALRKVFPPLSFLLSDDSSLSQGQEISQHRSQHAALYVMPLPVVEATAVASDTSLLCSVQLPESS